MDKKQQKSAKGSFLPARKIATNRDFTLAINDFGDLFGWGSNRDERLGLKNDSNDFIEYPRKYEFFINKYMRMVEVCCGNYHIAAIATNKDGTNEDAGYIFTWGLDLFGRLGYISDLRKNDKETQDQDNYVFRTTPVMLKIQDKVARVACGTDFTACLTVKGQVYTWGTNKWGNLGVENMHYTSEQYVVRQPALVEGLLGKFIIQIACGSKHMMALSHERRVYTWGSGDYGVLGLGDEIGHNSPQLVKDLANEEMITIITGDFNSGAINTNGHIYLWGNGRFGRLGHGSEENYNFPKKVEDVISKEKVFFCSIGFYHTILTCIDGKTYCWGYSENGRLGSVEKNECDQKKKFLTPRLIYQLNNTKISQVYAGHHHSLAITLNGKIIGWGENVHKVMGDIRTDEDKRKGVSKKTILYFPEELPLNKNLVRISGGIVDLWSTYFLSSSSMLETVKASKKFKIMKIACGGTHTLALTDSGDILSWGYGNFGQLGLGSERKSVGIPTLVHFNTDRKFMKIYSGNTHSMAISKDVYEVFTWGDGSKGQLGKSGESSAEPELVQELTGKDIVKGSCGYDFTACLTAEGKIYMFGSNANYKLGIDSPNIQENFPKSIDGLTGIKKISLGLHHAGAINSNGDVYTWGHGFYGQLGHNDNETVRIPKKVDMGEIKFEKIKCGTYFSLAVDKREMGYIWGRSLMNLSLDKNKLRPEIIDDFKTSKLKNIQAGYGNSLFLNKESDVFGCGDNEYYKAGADIQLERYVTKNPKYIKFDNDSKSKVLIEKIFCGYHSCYAISNVGDIYAWGNPRNNRLTRDFEDKLEKKPKQINIVWKNDSKSKQKYDDIDEEESNTKKMDEKDIMLLLNSKLRLPNVDELFRVIESLDSKYDDDEMDNKDEEFKSNMDGIIKSYPEMCFDIKFTDYYMNVVKLQIIRMNNLMIPKKQPSKEIKSKIPDMILIFLFEIEKIYTMIYIHPCNFYEIIEVLKVEEYDAFINGIKPLYSELENPYPNSFIKFQPLDNMFLIALFRILLVQDYVQFKNDIDSLFSKQKSFSELILEFYFFNKFKRSILIDIFEKTLRDLKALSESTLKKTNITVLNSLKALLTENIQGLGEKEIFKKEHIDELSNLVKSLIIDIDNNVSLISSYVAYCLRFAKRKIKKYLKEQGNYVQDKDKLKLALLRLLFKNTISRLFKRLSIENHYFLNQMLKYGKDSEVKKNIDNYLPIIGEVFDRIASNNPISYEFLNNQNGEIDNKNLEDGIGMINNVIKSSYLKLYDIFINKILKTNFQFKKEIISSILNDNLDSKIKRMYIDLKSLLEFLKILNKKKGKGAFFSNLQIFDIFEQSGAIKSKYTGFDPNYKIMLYLNTKFMIEPRPFIEKFAKELKLTEEIKDINIVRCQECHSILPHQFVLEKDINDFIIKPFKQKVKEKYLSVFSRTVKHPNFKNKSDIKSVKDLYERFRELFDDLSSQKIHGVEDAQMIIRELEDFLNDNRKEEEKLADFISLLHNHIKKKIKHYNFMRSSESIISDIENQKTIFLEKIKALIEDLNSSKDVLKSMKNSIDILDNKEKKEMELTHYKKQFVQYNDDNIFRYKLHEESLTSLIKKGILLEFEKTHHELGDIILQLSANNTKKFFDLKLSLKKTKELLKSYSFTYEDYVYYCLNSNTFTVLNFGDFGRYNCSLFLDLINQQINDK